MQKDIGIVVCNYNKRDYIINCIDSILNSSISNFDVYVVDNASDDDSVSEIERRFSDKVIVIKNDTNLGGSGGFNTGLVKAMEGNYRYLMCVDNDVVMDNKNIEELFQYMDDNEIVGMAGSRVMYMDQPHMIQSMGARLDFENYCFKDNMRNFIMDNSIEEVLECDYVPACSMMVRRSLIDEIGLIPQDTFVYWDDIEWGYKCKRAGYRIQSLSNAVVWHKGNFKNKTTFPKYYMWRNRISFFAKYLSEEKADDFCEKILSELFQMIYACYYKKEYKLIDTLMFALDDALHNLRGRARASSLFERDKTVDRLDLVLNNSSAVTICFNGDYDALEEITKHLIGLKRNISIDIMADEEETFTLERQCIFRSIITKDVLESGLKLKMCSHIFEVKKYEVGDIYIDRYCNIIRDQDDYQYCRDFQINKELFIRCHKNVFLTMLMGDKEFE